MASSVAVPEGAGRQTVLQWVVFHCTGRAFAFPLRTVREIIRPQRFVRLPGTGPVVCGLASLRGSIVTGFDLGIALGLSPSREVPDHRLLILEQGERRVVFAVDGVKVVATAPIRKAGPRSRALQKLRVPAEAILGVGRVDGGEFVALDPAPILRGLLR